MSAQNLFPCGLVLPATTPSLASFRIFLQSYRLPFTRACQAGYARTFRLTAAGRESSATITFFQATMSVSSRPGFDSYRGGGYN